MFEQARSVRIEGDYLPPRGLIPSLQRIGKFFWLTMDRPSAASP